jgi:predicted GNAT family N-acyltransferase
MNITHCHYHEQEPALRQVRDAVFIVEQQVPREIEVDDRDAVCRHVLIRDDDTPIACGRIDLAKGRKIGRLAVVSEQRGRGHGRTLLNELEAIAREAGLSEVMLHAQRHAEAFYAGSGYVADGEPFYEADIEHFKMRKAL